GVLAFEYPSDIAAGEPVVIRKIAAQRREPASLDIVGSRINGGNLRFGCQFRDLLCLKEEHRALQHQESVDLCLSQDRECALQIVSPSDSHDRGAGTRSEDAFS